MHYELTLELMELIRRYPVFGVVFIVILAGLIYFAYVELKKSNHKG